MSRAENTSKCQVGLKREGEESFKRKDREGLEKESWRRKAQW